MGLLDRLLRKPKPVAPGPQHDALVVYAVAALNADLDPDAPRFVSLRFDPADARLILDAPDAPAMKSGTIHQLRQRLVHATGTRDPNSLGRLRHLTDWLADHEPVYLAWRMETETDAAR